MLPPREENLDFCEARGRPAEEMCRAECKIGGSKMKFRSQEEYPAISAKTSRNEDPPGKEVLHLNVLSGEFRFLSGCLRRDPGKSSSILPDHHCFV